MLLRNEKGSSAIIITMSIGVLVGIVSFAVLTELKTANKNQKLILAKSSLARLKDNVRATLASPAALEKTILSNPNMNCLTPPGSQCNFADLGTFSLFNADGSILINKNAGAGLTINLQPCTGFVTPPASGNSNCPIRLEVSWNCENNGVICNMPTEYIVGNTIPYSPAITFSSQIIFNSDQSDGLNSLIDTTLNSKYNVQNGNLTEGGNNIKSICEAISGKFDSQSQRCREHAGTLSFFPASTVAGSGIANKIFVGFDGTGNPIVVDPPWAGSHCSGGMAVIGLSPEGRIICNAF